LILQADTVNTGSFDDDAAIVPKAKAAGAWVHICGAFELWASACLRLAHLTVAADAADSWSVDGQKTINVRCDNEALVAALQATGS
jgi:glutamate/tyrosine decarboxylase-like PLP-dependent enzyme